MEDVFQSQSICVFANNGGNLHIKEEGFVNYFAALYLSVISAMSKVQIKQLVVRYLIDEKILPKSTVLPVEAGVTYDRTIIRIEMIGTLDLGKRGERKPIKAERDETKHTTMNERTGDPGG